MHTCVLEYRTDSYAPDYTQLYSDLEIEYHRHSYKVAHIDSSLHLYHCNLF